MQLSIFKNLVSVYGFLGSSVQYLLTAAKISVIFLITLYCDYYHFPLSIDEEVTHRSVTGEVK